MNRWHLLALVALTTLISLTIGFFAGEPFNYNALLRTTMVSAALGAIVWAFDRWLWRLPFWHPWFVAVPNINGRWIVTGDITPFLPRDVMSMQGALEVTQNFSSISMKISWEEGGETKLRTKMPLAVHDAGFCAFPALVERSAQSGGPSGQSQMAGFYFQSAERLRESVTVRYSTDSLEMGRILLSKHVGHASWRNLWTR
jgi:hypothetical protein